MSTANKLTYLNGTKQAIKQAINEDFEVIDNNTAFREYADEISSNNAKYKDLIPKETKNATNTLDISNSSGLDKALVTQYGNTYQETTTGQNLLPNNQTTQTINGVTFTMNSDKSVSIRGTATVNTDYYFVGTSSQYEDFGLTTGTYNLNGCTGGSEQTYMLFAVMNRNGNIYYYNNTYAGGRSMIVETGDKFRIFIRVISGANVNTTIYPQINEGSTALSYEPYTNGASPNPDYPQDIHVVTGDNEINVVGKNLLKYPYLNTTSTVSGVTFTDNGDGSVTINGTSTSSTYSLWFLYENALNYNNLSFELNPGTYTFKGLTTNKVTMACNFYFSDNSNEYFSIAQNDVTKTITNKVKLNMRILVNGGTTVDNVTIYPQIEVGSSSSSFEPYNSNTYNIDLPVENLWGGFSNSFARTDSGVQFTANTDGTITANGTATRLATSIFLSEATDNGIYKSLPKGTYTVSGGGTNYIIEVYDKDNVVRLASINPNNSSVSFTISDTTNVVLRVKVASMVTINETIKLQLETGSKANSYTPYGTTPIELCKIGNYKDYIFKNTQDSPHYDNTLIEDAWYLNKQIGKVVLNGSETGWALTGSYNNIYQFDYSNNLIKNFSQNNNVSLVANYFGTTRTWNNSWTIDNIAFHRVNYNRIRLQTSSITTLENLKNWLTTHNLIVYYVLATPTTEEITESNYPTLYEQLNNIKLFEGVNHITMTNESGLDVDFDITYYKDWKLD